MKTRKLAVVEVPKPQLTEEEMRAAWLRFVEQQQARYTAKLPERIAALKERLDKDLAQIATSPRGTLRWGTSALETAAEYEIVREIKGGLDKGVALDKICKELLLRVLRGAAHPSTGSNLALNAYVAVEHKMIAREVMTLRDMCPDPTTL